LLIGSSDETLSRVWDDDDVQALRGFAAQAAIGVDRAQAQEDRATLAILADRDRIAKDLHDLVIQRLFATGLTLQSMARRSKDPEIAARLRAAVDDLDATIREIRGTIFQLGREGAGANLRGQINAVALAAEPMLGVRPHVDCVGPLDSAVPDSVRPHLVAVIVEALSNVGRHAEAAHVDVSVRIEGGGHDAMVVLEVRDDGRGFTPDESGSGLANMRDRARDLGGACHIVAAPGEGTAVRWTAPLSIADTP
jgi:signal transduction histidine kinase